jgi:multidrug efflux pump subunit AcrA (membrane-fusion protein)
VKKERAKEEQRAIREQMRQEAEERRELERQRKQVEKEESKYTDQISQLQAQLAQASAEKTAALEARIAELQGQLAQVAEQKEKIANLQNGKAGNVYIISNLGSYGDEVFKIGMTRRLDPQERVDELCSAGVPFPFDVHSMIFSNDAVSLETELHHILNDRRVNKVNLRKEFFHVTLDELEELVAKIAPTAEFKRTMLAEQYRQSLSIGHIEDVDESRPDDDPDADEEDE